MYGPFWLATTVIFILFLTGTISRSLSGNSQTSGNDFRLLSGAAGLIYGYTGVVPMVLWGLLRWFGASESVSLVECWALYGYANVVWIPVALVSWSPISILNWVFVGVGLALSGGFLVRNLWPVVNATDAKTSRLLLIAVIASHAGLALAIKFLVFKVSLLSEGNLRWKLGL